MISVFQSQVNGVYSNCLSSYKDCVRYIDKHKDGDIDALLIITTTRRKLYKECLNLLGQIYRVQKIDITRFLKLKKLHVYQLRKLGNRSLKKNRIFFSQLEALFRRCV
jgi:hypothetical protein